MESAVQNISSPESEVSSESETYAPLNAKDCKIIQSPTATREEKRDAFQRLCLRNEGLVNKLVYANRHLATTDYDEDDIRQQAYCGLLRAAKTFKPEQGAFSTYVFPWMRQYIKREAMNSGSIRLPVHIWEGLLSLAKKYAVGVSDERFPSCIRDDADLTKEEKRKYLEVYRIKCVTSLDTPIGEEEHGSQDTIGDLLAQSDADTEAEALRDFNNEYIADICKTVLNDRERWIITSRFVYNRTLEWCGANMPDFKSGTLSSGLTPITRERARQIESSAIRKLRVAFTRKGIHNIDEI